MSGAAWKVVVDVLLGALVGGLFGGVAGFILGVYCDRKYGPPR